MIFKIYFRAPPKIPKPDEKKFAFKIGSIGTRTPNLTLMLTLLSIGLQRTSKTKEG